MSRLLDVIHRTHLHRAAFNTALVPVAFLFGLEGAVVLVFLQSAYANVMTDIGAWEAKKARDEANDG